MRGELPRRLFHFLGSLTIAIAGLVLVDHLFLPLLLLATAGFVGLDAARFVSRGVNRWFLRVFRVMMRDQETARITGASYMALGAALAFLLFDKVVASMAVCFLAVGDPVSGMIGGKWGGLLTRKKSLASSAGCLAACLTVALVFYYRLVVPLDAAVLGAFFAVVVESLPLPVDDNLTIPVVSGGAATLAQLLGAG
ncbi:MAG: hypothetical protein AB1597_08535 [Chloroflexota bacterium]